MSVVVRVPPPLFALLRRLGDGEVTSEPGNADTFTAVRRVGAWGMPRRAWYTTIVPFSPSHPAVVLLVDLAWLKK